ncbi:MULTISPECIES: DUF4232 domain-containing protein [unclassified Streptomyces]|uniref:DUF4232 domain-containing protein n=1 Tax=unclassified Streptomyces TaxID=2593676 RepID=UPI00070CA9FB|nr:MULTISPECIES: DUF4232 domain-containing protein [unclassified Streptomyces]KRD18777.1 hypothetical protein ASE41_18420 [Streptomyces sp. Root264]MCX5267311.1 DUF4232 domain-containing protein [Streptomyces sp. NBC_00199]
MRAVPITVTALAAALLLTACSGGDDSGSGGDESKAATSPGAAGSACAAGDLGQEVGPVDAAPAAGDTGNVTVTLTNKGKECTLDGFPKVDLKAGDASASVTQDEAAAPQPLTLPAQGTASFTITYVRGAGSGEKSLAVKTVEYGLPKASSTADFPWSYGDVALKSKGVADATVSAFHPAGD